MIKLKLLVQKSCFQNSIFLVILTQFLLVFSSYDELVRNGVDFIGSLENTEKSEFKENGLSLSTLGISRQDSINSRSSFTMNENNFSKENSQLEEETRNSGSIDGTVYKVYLNSAGGCFTIFFISALFALSQFFASFGDFFVSEWSKMEGNSVNHS